MNSRLLQKLNNKLRVELGNNPMFGWKRTEELTIGMFERYDWVAAPNGILMSSPVYKQRMICQIPGRWVLANLVEKLPYEFWLERFGTKLEWPNGDSWYPATGPSGFTLLGPGETPTLESTEYAITCIKEHRAQVKTESDLRDEEARLARQAHQEIRDEIRYEVLPSFGLEGIRNPGSNWTSVISSEPKELETKPL